jgi:hypothetical protein
MPCWVDRGVFYLPPMASTKIDSGWTLRQPAKNASLQAGHREKIEEENISRPLVRRCKKRKLLLMRSRKFSGSRRTLRFLKQEYQGDTEQADDHEHPKQVYVRPE